MNLALLDWMIILVFFGVTMFVGLWVAKNSEKNSEEYFLGSRKIPWWLLGVSMVATTFSADTPNLVTDIVRGNGVSGNWAWWAFLLTGMLTVFVYARLWRRSGISTDLEFYELRYSGKEALFLRGFRALYLGVFFNVLIMATVILAGIKIGSVMLGLNAIHTVVIISVITVIYSAVGGFKGVIYTDFIQFCIAMLGMVVACIYILDLPQVGGLSSLLNHPNVVGKTSFLPDFNDKNALITLLIIPLAVQWWSVWYPGAEPGGGGYIAQRMLSAKDEKSAVKATLFFNIAHYALRPWPWILIALASLIVFPDIADIQKAFPHVNADIIKNDLAFSAMLTFLPAGLLGLVIAALIAALMSTISTHLNWGSSYVVHDFYKRFVNPAADESTQVWVGRMTTVVLMILAAVLALFLSNALQAFNILLQIGAGTGLLFILRWFWWRINALTEIVAMVASFIVALVMELWVKDSLMSYEKLVVGIIVTTVCWLATAWLSKPTDHSVLVRFVNTIRPYNFGWQPVIQKALKEGSLSSNFNDTSNIQRDILNMFLGCILVYALLFGTGFLLYGNMLFFGLSIFVSVISGWLMMSLWNKSKHSW
ncbi:MAG: Na+:solute symporter [Saprospiraceae bacterium]|nr:Na+:solute symporter [Saprospiraceae bacterium]